MVAYRFEDGRGADCVARHLGGFNGILQVVGYSAYTSLIKSRAKSGSNETIRLAGCWAHLRRKFYDLHVAKVSQVATASLTAMTELWTIEDEVGGKDGDSRAALRQEKSTAIVANLFDLWETELRKVSGKSRIALHEVRPHRFNTNAHHHGSLPQQLGVVWSPLLEADSEGPAFISPTGIAGHSVH